MSSREKILSSIRTNKPESSALPDINMFRKDESDILEKYMAVLESIGGKPYVVKSYQEIQSIVSELFPGAIRIVTTCPELTDISTINPAEDPHLLQDIELAVIRAHFAVAENAAMWITEDILPHRVLPYICQYLALVVRAEDIVPTMHHAYERIGAAEYGFGGFIAGPSKTADIEQALVLGAHGPKGMTAFILSQEPNVTPDPEEAVETGTA